MHDNAFPQDSSESLPSFAQACEICSRAQAEFLAQEQADQAGFPAQAAVDEEAADRLEATAAYPTEVLAAAEKCEDDDPASASTSVLQCIPKRAVAIAAAAAVLFVAAVAAFFGTEGFGMFDAVRVSDVERSLLVNTDFMDGYASNEYVDPSDYALSDVVIISEADQGDGVKRLQVSATLRNESFETSCNLVMDFMHAGEASGNEDFAGVVLPEDVGDDDWVGRIVKENVSTRAISGIDYDDDAPSGLTFSFNESSQTCSASDVAEFDLWFASVEVSQEYSYRFDGSSWTRRELAAPSRSVTYRDLEGTYVADGGDAGQFVRFSISDLDPAAGTFTVSYEKNASFLSTDAISGTISCTITPTTSTNAYGDYVQEDGFAYVFEGTGTSTGGAGVATITGAFTEDAGLVFTFRGDYTEQLFLGGTRDATSTKTGSFIK